MSATETAEARPAIAALEKGTVATQELPTFEPDLSKVAEDHVLSLTSRDGKCVQYLKVVAMHPAREGEFLIRDVATGLGGADRIDRFKGRLASSDDQQSIVHATATQLAEILAGAGLAPFKVTWAKQGSGKTAGEIRTMRCRLIDQDLSGRARVEMLDDPAEGDNRLRLVDNRTIKSIVLRGVFYILKGE